MYEIYLVLTLARVLLGEDISLGPPITHPLSNSGFQDLLCFHRILTFKELMPVIGAYGPVEVLSDELGTTKPAYSLHGDNGHLSLHSFELFLHYNLVSPSERSERAYVATVLGPSLRGPGATPIQLIPTLHIFQSPRVSSL
jgi:hypothetical protein